VFFAISPLAAQDKSGAPRLEFEVASIKLIDPSVPHMVGVEVYPGGRVVINGVPLKSLIAIAFRLSYWQISGGDGWMEKDNYNVEGKPPETLRSSIKDLRHTTYGIEDESLRAMLQPMLIDRFQLKFHRETKTGDVYQLERNGKTLRLRPTETALAETARMGSIGFAGGRWVIDNTVMPELAKFAADNVLHAPVLDRTELAGAFDYKQPTRLPDSEVNYSDPSDSFLRLMPELGLKLERTKGPVEILVIDQAARPSPN